MIRNSLYTIVFLLALLSSRTMFGQDIKIQTYKFGIDTGIGSVTMLNDTFYCLTSNGKLISIDLSGNLMTNLTGKIRNAYIYSKNDSLFAKKNDSIYYYNQKNFEYLTTRNENFTFYEDSDYVVTKSCSGEWGGSAYFMNKKTKIKYECEATCPVIVNKFNDEYILTSSLAHLWGSTNIVKIANPTKLARHNPDKNKGKKVIYVGDYECHSRQGTETMLDSVGIMTLTSFVNGGQLYHIITDYEKTYLCTIKDSALNKIRVISEKGFWSYSPYNFYNERNELICFWGTGDLSGFLYISPGNMKIYVFE